MTAQADTTRDIPEPAQPSPCLALDTMGGDHGPTVVVPAAIKSLSENPQLRLMLVGDGPAIEMQLGKQAQQFARRIEIVHTDTVIPSDANARAVLRSGKGTSLWTALERVADGRAQACVSAGNTVALMTLGVKLVGRLPGIKRPALMSHFPTSGGIVGMLDLGANLNVDAQMLFQFALMGALVRARHDGAGKSPTIGLLNVGHEESKGVDVLRDAHEMLKDSDLAYKGFIEGHDIYSGTVQLAVCDGFAGNLILKASEGLAGMLFEEFRQALTSDTRSRLGAWLARPALRRMLARLDPDKHNGAPLLGLQGVVVKSHGRSGIKATKYAILEAAREVERNIPEQIAKTIREHGAEDLT